MSTQLRMHTSHFRHTCPDAYALCNPNENNIHAHTNDYFGAKHQGDQSIGTGDMARPCGEQVNMVDSSSSLFRNDNAMKLILYDNGCI